MIRRISIFCYFSVLTLFLSCKKETVDSKTEYSQKANEVIQQVISDDPCGCILEIPKESSIEVFLNDAPMSDIRKRAINDLNLRNRNELDSLEKLSVNFILDTSFLKKRNIRVIKSDSLREKIKNLILSKKCPSGILSISKPVFDKNYTTALIYSSLEPSCVGVYPQIYKYENGKWKMKK